VRENAFWTPPPGWAPVEAAAAAPPDWRFWQPNPLWWKSPLSSFPSIALLPRLANLLAWVWIGLAVASIVLELHPAIRLVAFLLGFASLTLTVVSEVLKARKSKERIQKFAIVAQRTRTERLTREYQRYLTAMA
jgi:hypothetical protein